MSVTILTPQQKLEHVIAEYKYDVSVWIVEEYFNSGNYERTSVLGVYVNLDSANQHKSRRQEAIARNLEQSRKAGWSDPERLKEIEHTVTVEILHL